ncbi:MAG: metallophosphoesterase family protein [Brevibacterium yomogidense]|uniref:metallophosphoesterase family protein n=1 Tax=Brevibacterium TaxID=1696 RepID=UPI000C3ABB8E|nr:MULTISPECIES: metallophosphoesterase [Brevibacterium]SMX76960.1 hypothetical protein BSP109_01351 [Brevibacterium sp. Mu109]
MRRRLRGVLTRRPRWAGALRGAVVLLCCLVIVAPWAVLGAQAESTFGPHEAVYSVTGDSAIDADLGPLGSVVVPADGLIPFGLGVHIAVGEIPVESGVGGSTIDALGGDVTAYAALFSDPSAHARTVVVALAQDSAVRAAVGALALFALIVGVRALLGAVPGAQRRTLRVRGRRQALQAGAATTGLAVLAGALAVPLGPPRAIESDPVFIGTPLAGAEVTGRLSGVVDEAVQAATDMLRENDEFYAGVRTNLAGAWPLRPASTRLGPGPMGGLGTAGDTDLATVVWTSDIHCQTGMSRVIGDVVRWSDADLHIDGGDITMTGTDAENICVDSLDQALPNDVPSVFVTGNHDSLDTAGRARELGWTVMEGEPVEVAGLTLFGAGDPRRTVFPSGDVLETGETTEEFTARMAADACRADAGLLLIHDPRHAEPALASGCADYGLHGHWHRRVPPERYGEGVRTVGSTTGGALADALTPGPLKMGAEMSIMRIDRTTGAPVDVQYVSVGMDASVEFSDWVPFPGPAPAIVVDPTDEDADDAPVDEGDAA